MPFFFGAIGQSQADFHPRQQHRFGAQQAFDFGDGVLRIFKILWVWPHAHGGARVFFGASADFSQRFNDVTTRKHDLRNLAFAFDLYF